MSFLVGIWRFVHCSTWEIQSAELLLQGMYFNFSLSYFYTNDFLNLSILLSNSISLFISYFCLEF